MSKDLNNTERYLKELADKYKPAPPTFVWNEIEQVLDKDKRKRPPFLILWIFGTLILGAMVCINLREKKDKESPIVEQEIIISDYQKQSDPNPRNISTVDSKVINELKEGRNTNNLDTSTADRFLKANTNTINSNETAIITKEDIFTPSVFTQSTESTVENRPTVQVDTLQRLNWMVRPFETEISLPTPTKNLTDNIFSSHSKGNASPSKPWFIELGVGIGSNLRNPLLIDPTQGGFRINTERRWYSWSASLQLGYQFDNLWYTTIGFDLNQTKNRFEFWRRNISKLVVGENQSLQIINSDFFNIGEIKYTFADIGLSIGRRFNIEKWHFSLEGGPIFNVLFNASGKVQVGVMEFSRLEDQEEYFNTLIGVGARLSAMLDYPISEQMWMSVGPIYHQYFNTVSLDENPLEERNAILQVKAGVRYHF